MRTISSPYPSIEPHITFVKLLSSISTKSNAQANNHVSHRRRLARRGGVKRLSSQIYDEIRVAMQDRLRLVSSRMDHNTATQRLVLLIGSLVVAIDPQGLFHFPRTFETEE